MSNFYKLILVALVFIISSHSLGATTSTEAQNIANELNTKNHEHYSGAKFIKPREAKAIIEKIDNSTTLSAKEKLFLRIEACTLWANTSIASMSYEEDYPVLKELYKGIKDTDFRKGSLSSKIYTAFSDFASSMIPLARFIGDAYSYVFITESGEYARLALLKDPENTKASVLYGMCSSIPTNFLSNNQYSKSLQLMHNTEGLLDYMVFRTHIYRSMMHMRVNETEKAFEELSIAKTMFPNALYVYMLKVSYAKGETGFANAEDSDLEDLF